MSERRTHWETIYAGRSPLEVSWYQKEPALSLALIAATGIEHDAPIIDVGGGASVLVDRLLAAGYGDITVLDIAAAALAHAKARLAVETACVTWLAEDVTAFVPTRAYVLWHDRAVFHFLTDEVDRARYVAVLRRALPAGGHVVIGTFAVGGPERCSGLAIVQYDAPKLMAALGPGFTLVESRGEVHITPAGGGQLFSFFRLWVDETR